MIDIVQYLQDNYYSKYLNKQEDEALLITALTLHKDKVIVIRHEESIQGVAVFLTLSDETYQNLENIEIANVDNLCSLFQENGENIHFIIVSTHGIKNILCGIKTINYAKTISWWNPTNTKLHKYSLRRSVCHS